MYVTGWWDDIVYMQYIFTHMLFITLRKGVLFGGCLDMFKVPTHVVSRGL